MLYSLAHISSPISQLFPMRHEHASIRCLGAGAPISSRSIADQPPVPAVCSAGGDIPAAWRGVEGFFLGFLHLGRVPADIYGPGLIFFEPLRTTPGEHPGFKGPRHPMLHCSLLCRRLVGEPHNTHMSRGTVWPNHEVLLASTRARHTRGRASPAMTLRPRLGVTVQTAAKPLYL